MKFKSLFLALLMTSSALAVGAPVPLEKWQGTYKAVTLAPWMADSENYRNGIVDQGTFSFASNPSPGSLSEELSFDLPGAYVSTPRERYKIQRSAGGEYSYCKEYLSAIDNKYRYSDPVSLTQNDGELVLSRSDKDVNGEATSIEFHFEKTDEFKMAFKFVCCKISLGHLGCLLKGVCEVSCTVTK